MVRRRAHKTGKTDKGHGGQRGLSEVLMEFVGEIVPEDATDQEFEQSVELAVVLWNLALLPQEQQGEMLWRMRERADRGDDPFFAGRLHELIDVRMQRYGQDRRLVMESVDTIEPEGDGLRLVNIFGEQKFLKARIQSLSLVENRVLLVKTA